jgi:hypothetical protein
MPWPPYSRFSPESDDADIGPMMPPPADEAPKKKKRGKLCHRSIRKYSYFTHTCFESFTCSAATRTDLPQSFADLRYVREKLHAPRYPQLHCSNKVCRSLNQQWNNFFKG